MSPIQKPTTVKYKKAEFSDDQLRAKINQQTQHCKVPVWLWSSGYANCLDQTNSAALSQDTLYWLGNGAGEIITLTLYRNTKGGQEKRERKGKLWADFFTMLSESLAVPPEPGLYLDGLKFLLLIKQQSKVEAN